MKDKTKIILLIIIIILVLCSLYLYYENNNLQVSNYQITSNNIPDEFNNYKIIHISDFHNTKSKKLRNDLINEIKTQEPNIIVITGDLIDANKTDIDVAINFVKSINEIAPIYFVTGNHENSVKEYSFLKEKLEENSVVILDNDIEVLKINIAEINLIGINDPSIIHESFIEDSVIIKDELNNIEYNKNNYTILLSHRPETFDVYVEEGLNLVLTGHAHGGQVRIPFIGGIVAPNQGFFPKYTSGLFSSNDTTMIVSRGIGNSIIPFRINNRPELAIVTLNNS